MNLQTKTLQKRRNLCNNNNNRLSLFPNQISVSHLDDTQTVQIHLLKKTINS